MHSSAISRRTFVGRTAAAAAALAVAPLPALTAPRPKARLGVALVGLGYYSTDLLAPALQITRHCALTSIVTGSPEKIDPWLKKYKLKEKNVYNYQDFDRIADNPDVDVVYVVLPNAMHHPFVLRAARAGKHVFCEKPMALNARECEEMIQVCRDNRVTLTIGYRMQHEPNTREVMRLGQEKVYGSVGLVVAGAGFRNNDDGSHWKLKRAYGGGAMMDMGVYALQGARYVVGEEPTHVTAQHFTNRPDIFKEVDETTTFQLKFPGGTVAHLHTSFGTGMNYLVANAERGWFRLNPFCTYENISGDTSDGRLLNQPVGYQQARQMDNDALAIKEKTAVRVPGEEGLRDMRVVDAIFASARTGRTVRLDEAKR